MDGWIFFIIIALILFYFFFNVCYYIPNKLKKQEEKHSLYMKELYIRLNALESKIDKLIHLNKKGC